VFVFERENYPCDDFKWEQFYAAEETGSALLGRRYSIGGSRDRQNMPVLTGIRDPEDQGGDKVPVKLLMMTIPCFFFSYPQRRTLVRKELF